MINIPVIQPSLFYTCPIISLIPAMTSNTTPSGIASSSENSGIEYWAFNRTVGSTNGWFTSNNNLPCWLQYQFGRGNIIKKYQITSLGFFQPTNYSLQVSNDGSSWITLDTKTSYNGSLITLSNTTRYLYYRIYITNNQGSPAFNTNIQYWQLFGY